jgi:hypothetical protein
MAITKEQRKLFKKTAAPPPNDAHKGPRPPSADEDEDDDQDGEGEYEDEDETESDEGEGNEEQSEGEGEDFKEGGPGKYGMLIPVIEQFAQDIEACCDELDTEYLTDTSEEMPEDEKQILQEGYDALEDNLKEALSVASGITPDDAMKLAQHLADEDIIEDDDRVAGWLVRLGQII